MLHMQMYPAIIKYTLGKCPKKKGDINSQHSLNLAYVVFNVLALFDSFHFRLCKNTLTIKQGNNKSSSTSEFCRMLDFHVKYD